MIRFNLKYSVLNTGLVFFTLLLCQNLFAQKTVRQQIDDLLTKAAPASGEMYLNANRAKQMDSTYYVGYFMEGLHYFYKAEEQSGFARAVEPLEKARVLFENDFGRYLSRWYNSESIIRDQGAKIFRQRIYMNIISLQVVVYNSLEQLDAAYRTIMNLKKKNMAFDLESYHWLAWLYFRSRVFDSGDHPFLKDTIEENLKMAELFTDSLEVRYKKNTYYIRNQILNLVPKESAFYQGFYSQYFESPLRSIANTRGILHGYNLNPKLATRYFMKLDDEGVAKHVNIGYSYHSDIDFRKSEESFEKVPDNRAQQRGGHWQGYSTIFVYKGEPLQGALNLREKRDQHGFTIGYGWDNLCLARMYLYAGQIRDCDYSLSRAESFSEVHFNSSFREDQYHFMNRVLRLMQTEYELKAKHFENRNRWLSWDWWKALPALSYDKYTTLYTLANELALNREREIIYYHIFHPENIISFDEIWNIISQYSSDFFMEKFKAFAESDPRSNLQRYYAYFQARLMALNGDGEAAYDLLTEILTDPELDRQYEKLLLARVHEVCAGIAREYDWNPQLAFHRNELYRIYPQLIPFSGVTMRFTLKLHEALENNPPEAFGGLMAALQDCNIEWVEDDRDNTPTVHLTLGAEGKIAYEVTGTRESFTSGAVELDNPRAGKQLAYRLFRVFR